MHCSRLHFLQSMHAEINFFGSYMHCSRLNFLHSMHEFRDFNVGIGMPSSRFISTKHARIHKSVAQGLVFITKDFKSKACTNSFKNKGIALCQIKICTQHARIEESRKSGYDIHKLNSQEYPTATFPMGASEQSMES